MPNIWLCNLALHLHLRLALCVPILLSFLCLVYLAWGVPAPRLWPAMFLPRRPPGRFGYDSLSNRRLTRGSRSVKGAWKQGIVVIREFCNDLNLYYNHLNPNEIKGSLGLHAHYSWSSINHPRSVEVRKLHLILVTKSFGFVCSYRNKLQWQPGAEKTTWCL